MRTMWTTLIAGQSRPRRAAVRCRRATVPSGARPLAIDPASWASIRQRFCDSSAVLERLSDVHPQAMLTTGFEHVGQLSRMLRQPPTTNQPDCFRIQVGQMRTAPLHFMQQSLRSGPRDAAKCGPIQLPQFQLLNPCKYLAVVVHQRQVGRADLTFRLIPLSMTPSCIRRSHRKTSTRPIPAGRNRASILVAHQADCQRLKRSVQQHWRDRDIHAHLR